MAGTARRKLDGIMGPRTRQAIRDAQKHLKRRPDGLWVRPMEKAYRSIMGVKIADTHTTMESTKPAYPELDDVWRTVLPTVSSHPSIHQQTNTPTSNKRKFPMDGFKTYLALLVAVIVALLEGVANVTVPGVDFITNLGVRSSPCCLDRRRWPQRAHEGNHWLREDSPGLTPA